LPEIGDWDAGTVTPPSKGSNVQLAINTATLGAMGSLAAPQVCAFYRAERLAIAVVRIDEGFVELEPDALALGAPRKTRDERPLSRLRSNKAAAHSCSKLSSMYVATPSSVARHAQGVNVPSSCCATHASQPLSWVETHYRI
jgi:hypothetical protein